MNQNMDQDKKVEWRIKVVDGSSEIREAGGFASRLWHWLWSVIVGLPLRLCRFVKIAWELGMNDPRKFIHCLKVGIALTVVSLFYYMKPLYNGVGGNAMWAVMTVVVVFEYSAGATVCKSINRICGTSLAGFLGIGVHWLASRAGRQFEPLIVGISLFLLASAATFSRFIPTIKARFDYGAMIFILTFSLVSVSGYRIDELLTLAQQRISTILIGTCLCIIVSVIICPVWAGQELYALITSNMDKLANSLDGCVTQYFDSGEKSVAKDDKEHSDLKRMLGYKCVLSSKATEDSLANFARWEPAHGRFNLRHPWKQYLKIGASVRSCASCIDALVGCINSENQAPDDGIKKHMSESCVRVGSKCGSVLREVASTMRNMTRSSNIDVLVAKMSSAAKEVQDELSLYPNLVKKVDQVQSRHCSHNHNNNIKIESASAEASTCGNTGVVTVPEAGPATFCLMETIQVITMASLLIEIVARVEGIVNAVEELAQLVQFQPSLCLKSIDIDIDNIDDKKKNSISLQQINTK